MEAVRKRLRFESGLLRDVEDLREISIGVKGRLCESGQALAYE
jgi:hypothetical protein